MPAQATIAAVHDVAGETGNGSQRHLDWAPNGALWWAVFTDSTDTSHILIKSSPDMVTWTTRTSLATAAGTQSGSGSTFSIWIADLGGNDTLHLHYSYAGTIYHARGAISGTSITWNTAASTGMTTIGGDGGTTAIDSTAAIWEAGAPANDLVVAKATNTDAGTSWTDGWPGQTTLYSAGTRTGSHALIPLASGDMLAIGDNGSGFFQWNNLEWFRYTGTWTAPATVRGSNLSSAQLDPDWAWAKLSNTDVHVVMRTGASSWEHFRYNGSGWSAGDSIGALAVTAGNGVALASNGTNVWMFAISGTDIQSNQWTAGTGWGGWTALGLASATRTQIGCCQSIASATAGLYWTEGSGVSFSMVGYPFLAAIPGTASAAFQLDAFTLTATAVERPRASAAFAPGAFTMAAAVSERETANGAMVLGPFQLAAAAHENLTASAAFQLGAFHLAAETARLTTPTVVREILLDTTASNQGYNGFPGADGGDGWGPMKSRIVRLANGDVLVTVIRAGPYDSVRQAFLHKTWSLYRITPSMVTNLTTPLSALGGPEAGPYVSGREAPNLLRRNDDSYVVIGPHPNAAQDDSPTNAPGQDSLGLESGPFLYDSRDGLEHPLPGGAAGFSLNYWNVRWGYWAARVNSATNEIWVIQNDQNTSVLDSTGTLDVDFPGGYRLGYSPDGTAAYWTVTAYTYNQVRTLYDYLYPRPDLGPGGVEFLGMLAAQWHSYEVQDGFVYPGDGTTYLWDGLAQFRVANIGSTAITATVKRLEPQASPPDHPFYEAADVLLDDSGVYHVGMDGKGVFFGGPGVDGAELVQVHPDGSVTHSPDPIRFGNQARTVRGVDRTYWRVGAGTAYPVTPGVSPNEFRYSQAAPGDTDATVWQTYGGGHQYQIIPLGGIASSLAVGSDRVYMADERGGSDPDPDNHVHLVFSDGGGYAWYVDVALPFAGDAVDASAALRPGVFTLAASATAPPTLGATFLPGPFLLAGAAQVPIGASGLFLLGAFTLGALAREQEAGAAFRLGAFSMGAAAVERVPHVGPLAITSVTPDVGATATLVVIRGSGFFGTTRVMFGSLNSYVYPFLLPDVISDTEIHVYAPLSPFYLAGGNHDDLTVDIQVFTLDEPGGSPIVAADQYTFLAPPVVYAVSPNAGSTQVDTPVVITGKNFHRPITVQLDGQDVAGLSEGDVSFDGSLIETTLSTTAFPEGVGSYALRVWNVAGPSDWFNPVFTIYSALVPDPTPLVVQQALSGQRGPVNLRYRFEERLRDNSFVRDLTSAVREDTGCVIHLDNDQAVARTADFVFEGPNLPTGFDCGESTLHAVAVFADLRIGVTTYSWQLGLFHLDMPQRVQYPRGTEEWHAKGSDMCLVLADRTSRAPFTVRAGSSYIRTIETICHNFGLVTSLPGLNVSGTPVDLTWPANTPWLTIVNDLLYGLNLYPIWADETGRMTSRVRVDPALEAPQVLYDTVAEPRMVVEAPSTRSFSVSALANWINVAIDDPTRDPYVASATNNDPDAPASLPASQKLNFKAITGSGTPSTRALLNAQVAQAIAAFEIRAENTRAVTRTLETQPDPRRTNRESYLLHLEGFEVDTLWRVRGWELACTAGGPMTHTLERAQAISVAQPANAASVIQTIGSGGDGAQSGPVSNQGAILAASIPVTQATVAGNTIVVVILTDQTTPLFWSVTDSAGNPYTVESLDASTFGTQLTGGQFSVGIATCQFAAPLLAGDSISLDLNVGAFQVALAAFEVGGIDALLLDVPDGDWAKAVASNPTGLNTLLSPDSGATPTIANAYDLIVGIVGAAWDATAFDGEPAPAYSFTPLAGDGWENAPSVTVRTQPVNGLFALLSVSLQVGLTPNVTYRMRGTLSDAAAGWGAFAVPLKGVQP